jgi:hypothetical protein
MGAKVHSQNDDLIDLATFAFPLVLSWDFVIRVKEFSILRIVRLTQDFSGFWEAISFPVGRQKSRDLRSLEAKLSRTWKGTSRNTNRCTTYSFSCKVTILFNLCIRPRAISKKLAKLQDPKPTLTSSVRESLLSPFPKGYRHLPL